MRKPLVLLTQSAPYGTLQAKEALDLALANAAFDVEVTVIFIGDGVFQLINNQRCEGVEQKSLEKTLSALEIFGVKKVLASRTDLNARGLQPSQLPHFVELVSDQTILQYFHLNATLLTL